MRSNAAAVPAVRDEPAEVAAGADECNEEQPECSGRWNGREWPAWPTPRSISEPLHEPEPRMTWRIVVDAAEFGVAVAPVEVGCLEACRIETNPDATAGPGDLFGLRQQA